MIMGISAALMQAACAKKKEVENIISIMSTIADPSIYQLSCQGEIKVQSIKNGAQVEQTYTDLSSANLSIQADAETEIKILGNVTDFSPAAQYQGWGYADTLLAKSIVFNCETLQTIKVSGKSSYDAASTVESIIFINCTALQTLQCSDCTGLTSLDLSANTALQTLNYSHCTGLTSLDLAANTQLQYLDCGGIPNLTSLDLAANTQLQYLDCGGIPNLTSLDLAANTQLQTLNCNSCTGLTLIKYGAGSEDISTAIAGAITAATAADGTVYTDSAGAYYSTIADAATAKGWTIEQLA